MYLIVCLFLAVVATAQGGEIVFTAVPNTFDSNTVPILTLNCTLQFDPQSNKRLQSLSIWNSTTPLVSIDLFGGNAVNLTDSFLDSSGFINGRGESYLHLVKRKVAQKDIQQYKCIGTFVDFFGNTQEQIKTQTVSGNITTTGGTDGTGGNGGTTSGDTISPSILQLTEALIKIINAEKFFKNLFYDRSEAIGNRFYYLSRIPLFDIDLAKELCKFILEGTLANVANVAADEKQQILNYINVTRNRDDVITGDEPSAGECGKLTAPSYQGPNSVTCTNNVARFLCKVDI